MTPNLSVNTVEPVQAVFNSKDILPQILKSLLGKDIARSSAVSSFFNGVVKEDVTLRRIVMRSKIVRELSAKQEIKIPDKALCNLISAQEAEDRRGAFENALKIEKTSKKIFFLCPLAAQCSDTELAAEIVDTISQLIQTKQNPEDFEPYLIRAIASTRPEEARERAMRVADVLERVRSLSFVAVEEAKRGIDQAQNTIEQAIEFARAIQDASDRSEALLFAAAMQVHVSGKDAAKNTFRESLQSLETIEFVNRTYPQLIADWKSVSPEEVLDLIHKILTSANFNSSTQAKHVGDSDALLETFKDSYLSFYASTQAELGDCDAGLETASKIKQINNRLPVLSQIVCLLQAKDKEKATAVYREMESHLRGSGKFAEQFHRFCSCITGLYAIDRIKYDNFTRRMKERITKSENPSTRSSYLATLGSCLRAVDAEYAAEVLNEARIHAMEITVPEEKVKILKIIAKYQASVDPEGAYATSFLIDNPAKRMKVLAKIALKL